jgi:hypothetical protein
MRVAQAAQVIPVTGKSIAADFAPGAGIFMSQYTHWGYIGQDHR